MRVTRIELASSDDPPRSIVITLWPAMKVEITGEVVIEPRTLEDRQAIAAAIAECTGMPATTALDLLQFAAEGSAGGT